MRTQFSTPVSTLAALVLQAAFAGPAFAKGGALYYDVQTSIDRGVSSVFSVEGMAWGYYTTGPLEHNLTLSANDPVAIQLYDKDAGERNVGGADDEVQLWMSDTDLTALAGESVRFEFHSVVPADLLDAAGETWEGGLELNARFVQAPSDFVTLWNAGSWSTSGRYFDNRSSTFDGYPAADHVVHLYYVHPGQGFGGYTPDGKVIPAAAEAGNKKVWAAASVPDTMILSSTNESIWDNGISGREMGGVIMVQNTSDREGLTVNLDFLKLAEDDSPHIGGNEDDVLGVGKNTAPANFNLGPGGTLKWRVSVRPEWSAIEEARDFKGLDGDLEPYAKFSVSGDPDLPLEIVSEEEVAAIADDLPPSTFTFAAAEETDSLPPAPTILYSGASSSYTVDQEVNISCDAIENGAEIVFHTCVDIYAPAWVFPAGTNTYSASAFDIYGQEGTGSVSFEVGVTYDSLIAITERFVDHSGTENSLVAKIKNAKKAKTDSAQNGLCEAYINEVEAQTGKYVPTEYAEVLIYWAEQLELQ